ncbi:hypothetical protein AB0933_32345 [Streptomyces venezuelae]|uniref:hypothetical protein n=1 Tax=Streptomyces venezuelae TaxID=54571 RepID=UPI0034566035
MAAQLAATVYVQDPETHQTVELAPGSSPEPRLAALVPNPAAWVDGKLPRLPKTANDGNEQDSGSPSGGPDDTDGDAPASSDAADLPKPAARKTAATKPARGRSAADEGTSGA